MRLFAAIPMPAAARSALTDVLGRLAQRGWPVRWVREDQLHLTLKFYGEVREEEVGAVEDALVRAVRGTPPISLRLDGLGAFPTLRSPRVIWAGIEAPPALELMQHRVELGSDCVGFPPEGKPFRPHVTLGRVKKGGILPKQSEELLEALELDLTVEANAVVLFESRLSRNGAEHLPRQTIALEPIQVS